MFNSFHLKGHGLGICPQSHKLHNKQHHRKVLLSSFCFNRHTLGLHPQTIDVSIGVSHSWAKMSFWCYAHYIDNSSKLFFISNFFSFPHMLHHIVCNCAVPGKNPYPPNVRSSEIPRGRGVLKVKILEAMYEAKLEYSLEEGGAKQRTFCGGSMDIFWNCTL